TFSSPPRPLTVWRPPASTSSPAAGRSRRTTCRCGWSWRHSPARAASQGSARRQPIAFANSTLLAIPSLRREADIRQVWMRIEVPGDVDSHEQDSGDEGADEGVARERVADQRANEGKCGKEPDRLPWKASEVDAQL